MKQVVQNYQTGELRLEEVPVPICRPGGVVVRAAYSVVSSGTERMKVEQARMNKVQMARARPDKVKQVIQSIRQVGLAQTYEKVRERLGALVPLGYSLAGTVAEVGAAVDECSVGDRVACAGEGIACHAELVFVPRNLCVRVPHEVTLHDAAFATVGAIAINGVRQAGVTLGDNVLVIGLGLVGLLAVQILKAAGCRVMGIDLDASKVALAQRCGADESWQRNQAGLDEIIFEATGGAGVDVAYIAASTSSTDPMELAGKVTRDRGRVVIVGQVSVQADWQTYYAKELSVVMSRSYGPGRYDRAYEQQGIEYPIGYVRWTERRNLQEFVRLLAAGSVKPGLLQPQVFTFADAPHAYQALHDSPGEHGAGIIFEYDQHAAVERRVTVKGTEAFPDGRAASQVASIGMIGAGNFATGTLIPALKALGMARLRAICSAGGLAAKSAALRHGFEYCASDYQELLADDTINAVVIATRHDTHARMTVEALRAGKHVFVEKPLALSVAELQDVIAAERESGRIVQPGFNRRFSSLSAAVRAFFAARSGPIEVICRVNAGKLDSGSWYHDPAEGGWRIVSEGCHFIDLIQYICGCEAETAFAQIVGGDEPGQQNDNCAVTLRMADGSLGILTYIANGDASYEKERIEAFGQGRAAVIENWRAARLQEDGRVQKVKPGRADKGHGGELAAFVTAVCSGAPSPLPFADAIACTRATFAVQASVASGQRVRCADVI